MVSIKGKSDKSMAGETVIMSCVLVRIMVVSMEVSR